jgi:phosphoglycerol transferase
MGYFFSLLGVLITSALAFSAKWAMNYFGLSCFEQIVFHLKVPLEGTNTEFLHDWVRLCFSKAIAATVIFLLLILCVPIIRIESGYISAWLCLLFLIIAAHRVGFFEWVINQFRHTGLYDQYYTDPHDVHLEFPEQKQNLIHIFMESMETTYTSKENGGDYPEDLIPELSKLAKDPDNVHFSHTDRMGGAHVVAGTGWTTGGMVAQTAGVGLTVPTVSHRFKENTPFLGHSKTLGDILEEQGYQQELCIGSDATFGGRRYYYEQHGHTEIFDYEKAKAFLPEGYHVFWGFEDEKLVEFAKQELTRLAAGDQPFHFTLLTVDTHHPKGYKGHDYQDIYPERLSNIIRISSARIGELVEWIQQQPFYANTTVMISGDHTSMAEDYIRHTYEKDYDRTVYNVFLHAKNKTEYTHRRLFTTMDLFPTTLSAMGVKIPGHRLGLGTDLFSGQKTLAETVGLEKLDQELRKQSDVYWKKIL